MSISRVSDPKTRVFQVGSESRTEPNFIQKLKVILRRIGLGDQCTESRLEGGIRITIPHSRLLLLEVEV